MKGIDKTFLTWALILGVALSAILLMGQDCFAQTVDFPDPNLEQAIRNAIGKPTGDIYCADLLGLLSLLANSRGISDLSGLECCTALTWIGLSDNQIVDLSPLAGLTNLTELWLDYNQIVDVSPLAGMTNLTSLDLMNNQIVDLSPLAGLTNLTSLNLWKNQIVDVSPLAGLTNLSDLRLDYNQIVDMCPLVNNLGLDSGDEVYLQYNPLDTNSCTVCIPQLQGRGVSVDHSCAPDADGDCLPDHFDPCPLDQDCDDDGLIDGNCFSGDLSGQDSRVKASGECVGYCVTEDVNNNGLVDFGETDPELFDTDGDGISDGVEKGLVEPPIPEATDPLVFVPDADPSTTTDPTRLDTDRDGIPDGEEDLNHNGQVDEGETDPSVRDNGFCSGSASASTHQASKVYGSKVLTRHLAYLLLPVGMAILLTSRRRRK